MVWHSQYVQYVSVCHSTGKCPKCVTYEICSKHVPNMFQTFSSRTSLGWKVPICCLFCLLPGLQNLQQQHLPLHRSPVKMAPCENFNSEMFERVSKWYQVIHMWFFFQDFMVQKPSKTTMRVASKRNAQNAQRFWDGQSSIMSIMSSRSSSHGYGHLGVLSPYPSFSSPA